MFNSRSLEVYLHHLRRALSNSPSKLETIALVLMSLNLYGRAVWLALEGEVLNPAVNIISLPIALLMTLWLSQATDSSVSSSSLSSESKQAQDLTKFKSAFFSKNSCSLYLLQIFVFSLSGLGILLCTSAFFRQDMINTEMILKHEEQLLFLRNLFIIVEGIGLYCLWSAWLWRKYILFPITIDKDLSVFSNSLEHNTENYKSNYDLVGQLHYPLSFALFTLPWEAVLRNYDDSLQRISTDIAVYLLDLIDWFKFGEIIQVAYWDAITIYSDRFYLIINETCAGVNLLLSMSIYALGYAWLMKCTLKRSWLLVAYMMPLCLLFNGLRICMIFCLGHFGDQALATGPWHEGSAYVSQALLFITLGLINYGLGAEPKSVKHDP